ncbi:1436_t:CDS:1 [Funneliformis geosporum]|uniref:16691_t:CDS:1 n=1 Tax=Funneliformis geosporum TaxID=1117311 RepID=A0A9W4WT14_9GLOM|nr:16691_t:CDS:1 [Funneliformis geosporum]CAI2165235.1 1436_t:CDS:1 [Funneliformis geosporum]
MSSIQNLPQECLLNILTLANSNFYSCIQVNKRWSNIIVPTLWSRPFNDPLMPTTPNGVKLMDTYISCLSIRQKQYLNNEGISLQQNSTTAMTLPRINYPEYLQELDYEVLEQFTRRWILENYHSERDSSIHLDIYIDSLESWETEYYNKQSQKLLSCLYSMFIEKSTQVTCFNFYSSDELCLDLPSLSERTSYSTTNRLLRTIDEQPLWNLKTFICKIDGYDLHLKNLMKFMENLSKKCKTLEVLDISLINRHEIKICNQLAAMIENQSNLKEIRLHATNYVGINRIIDVLVSTQRDSLLNIQFVKVDFGCSNNISGLLDSLNELNELEMLALIHCHGFNPYQIHCINLNYSLCILT